jgi:hypothetical protein
LWEINALSHFQLSKLLINELFMRQNLGPEMFQNGEAPFDGDQCACAVPIVPKWKNTF